jgi:hypothetical protein
MVFTSGVDLCPAGFCRLVLNIVPEVHGGLEHRVLIDQKENSLGRFWFLSVVLHGFGKVVG